MQFWQTVWLFCGMLPSQLQSLLRQTTQGCICVCVDSLNPGCVGGVPVAFLAEACVTATTSQAHPAVLFRALLPDRGPVQQPSPRQDAAAKLHARCRSHSPCTRPPCFAAGCRPLSPAVMSSLDSTPLTCHRQQGDRRAAVQSIALSSQHTTTHMQPPPVTTMCVTSTQGVSYQQRADTPCSSTALHTSPPTHMLSVCPLPAH